MLRRLAATLENVHREMARLNDGVAQVKRSTDLLGRVTESLEAKTTRLRAETAASSAIMVTLTRWLVYLTVVLGVLAVGAIAATLWAATR